MEVGLNDLMDGLDGDQDYSDLLNEWIKHTQHPKCGVSYDVNDTCGRPLTSVDKRCICGRQICESCVNRITRFGRDYEFGVHCSNCHRGLNQIFYLSEDYY